MTSFWKTVWELGSQKLGEMGWLGVVLGLIWVLGIGMWGDFMMGAFAEGMSQPGTMYGLLLVAWILVGLGIYIWQDPHGLRSSRESIRMRNEGKAEAR